MKSLVVDELRNFFRPELLNRLDDIIVFRKLQTADVNQIAERMLKETADRMAEKGIFKLTVNNNVTTTRWGFKHPFPLYVIKQELG